MHIRISCNVCASVVLVLAGCANPYETAFNRTDEQIINECKDGYKTFATQEQIINLCGTRYLAAARKADAEGLAMYRGAVAEARASDQREKDEFNRSSTGKAMNSAINELSQIATSQNGSSNFVASNNSKYSSQNGRKSFKDPKTGRECVTMLGGSREGDKFVRIRVQNICQGSFSYKIKLQNGSTRGTGVGPGSVNQPAISSLVCDVKDQCESGQFSYD